MYELPNLKFNFQDFKSWIKKLPKNKSFRRVSYVIIFALLILGIGIYASFRYFPEQSKYLLHQVDLSQLLKTEQQPEKVVVEETGYVSDNSYEQAIINVVKSANDSVVSIIISKDMPTYEQEYVNPFGDNSLFNIQVPQMIQNGTEYKEIGSGSGFIVSSDGLVLTNKHVVSDKKADYTIMTNDGEKYSAKVLATDPVQDLAIIKIDNTDNKTFNPLKLGDSDGIQLGQAAIAIGNALGEFSNTVSVGIVSGLSRTISASDQTGKVSETLEDIIQTDAAINSGNSGGPLLNLKGEVIGINTAIAQDAQSVAFALPINYAKKDIDQVIATNTIVYPFLGVRYMLINNDVKKEYDLSVDYGALVSAGNSGESAVTKNSAADKAGIKSKDIILEFNGEKITTDNTLSKIIQKYNVGDSVTLKILRDSTEMDLNVVLGERTE